MAWHQPDDKPLSEPMIASLLIHIYVSLGLNELITSLKQDGHIYSSLNGITIGSGNGLSPVWCQAIT